MGIDPKTIETKRSFFFVVSVALLLGLSLGYVLGNWRIASQRVGERPKVFGLGVESIDTPRDPGGVTFNLTSVFAFTNDYFHCVIATNDRTFTMATYGVGNVEIPQNQFFMSVDSTRIESAKKLGSGQIELAGTARSITRVGDKYEDAAVPFKAVAVDGGPGHFNDSLVLTVFYSNERSPMQFAIFGPEPHFGHGILSGDITIISD